MKLYLAQHGEALPREEDPERPLSQQGRRDVQAIAKMLDAAGIRVARVWHSGKRRAGQTAAIIAERVCPRCRTEAIDGIKPNDSTAEFSQDVDVWQEDDPERELVSYYPGSVVCLERSGAHSWSVQWMLRPDVFAAHRQAED
jgi:phosphohistidine phosphatase